MEAFDVVIVGGGCSGLCLAALIGARKHRICVVEKMHLRDKPKRAFLLQPNGLAVLDQIGVLESLKEKYISLKVIRAVDLCQNQLVEYNLESLNSDYNYVMAAIPEELEEMLEFEALHSGVQIEKGQTFERLLAENHKQGVQITTASGLVKQIWGKIIIGSDGPFSRVRKQARISHKVKEYSDGYMVSIAGETTLGKSTACNHIGRGTYLAAFPIDRQRTWLLDYVPVNQVNKLQRLTISQYKERLSSIAPELVDLRPLATWEDVLWAAPAGIRCDSWVSDGIALIGDAAHTMNPSLGQNLNLSFEDALVLSEVIDAGLQENNLSREFLLNYEQRRRSIVELYYRQSEYSPKLFVTHNIFLHWLGKRILRKIASEPQIQRELLEFATGIKQKAPSMFTVARLIGLLP
jgi:2-polyprenyl-6-methoxyphenol hydroxylase-like FAD-dependent oxidoreductase